MLDRTTQPLASWNQENGFGRRVWSWRSGSASDRLPVLALHGFTGSGLDFGLLAPLMGRGMTAPDLVGHGESDAPENLSVCSMAAEVARLAAWSEQLPCSDLLLLGYSMGARTALNLTLALPDRFSALVLVGPNPGFRDPDDRSSRQDMDSLLANRIEDEGVEAFVDDWIRRPVIASQSRITDEHRLAMESRRREARPRGLANSLRCMGAGAMEPVWDRLVELALPVLVITGSEDERYCEVAREMCSLLPCGEHRVLAHAGHCAHLEQPEAFVGVLDSFVDRLLTQRPSGGSCRLSPG